VTTGCARSICGNPETSAARIARSAQSDEASDSLAVVDWFRISGVRLVRIVGTDDQRISDGFELDLASGARLGFRLSI